MNFGSLFLFFILLVATISVAKSADLPKIKRGCTTNMARTELTNTPCTPFVFNGEEYNDGCADYYGRYLWCSTGNSWTYCGPCLDDVAKENDVAKVTTPVAKENTEVAKENTEIAKESTEVAKENTEVAKENQGSDEKTETKEDTLPKNTATDTAPSASTTEKTEEVPEKTENKPVEVEEPAHKEKEPENVAENKKNVKEEAENKDDKTADVPAEAATEEPKATAEDKATKTAETPESKTTEPAKEPATEDEKETKVEPKNVETPVKEAEVTAQTPEKEATIQSEVAPKIPNKEVEPEVVAPKKPSVTTTTSECDDEDDCAEGDASGAGLPEKTEEKKTEDTPVVATEEKATAEAATVEGATKETKEADNTNGGEKNEVKEVVEVDVNFEIEEEEPIIVEGENKGSKKNNQGVSNVFKITIIVCVVFLLTGIVITGIIVKKRLHRDEYLAGREEKGLKIDLDGVKANSHEKITSVDNVA